MNELIEKAKKIYEEHQEVISYIFWGGMNTLVNLIFYYICTRPFGMDPLVANVITWIIGCLFAFFTNKIFVFKSKSKGFSNIMSELIKFSSGRLGTFFIGEGLTFLGVNIMHIHDLIVWFFVSAFVALLNYFVGKIFAFKK